MEKSNAKNKRKHITLTIQEKLDIINLVEEGHSSRQSIALKYGIGKSTVHDIHKRRDKIRSFASLHNSDDINKRRRVDPKSFIPNDEVPLQDDVEEHCEEEMIESIEGFDYQEISEQDYEIVYEASLPGVNEDLIEEPNKTQSPRSKRKSKTLTFREKYDIILQIENGMSVPGICEKYGIGRTTVYDYMRRKQDIIDFITKSDDGERRTFKKSKFPEVEDHVLNWCESREIFTKQEFYENAKSTFEDARENGSVSSGFCGSWSWAKRFFHRHPELKRKLVTPSGHPLDPAELSLSIIEYLDEEENLRPSPSALPIQTTEVDPSSMNTVKRIKYLRFFEKLEVLDDIDAGKSIQVIAEKFGVSKTTIYDIFKRRQELRGTKLTKNNFWRKVMKVPRYPQLEHDLLRWCLKQRKFPLSHVLIADKAMCLYETLELDGNFKPSSTWAKKFVLRHPELCQKQGIPIEEDISVDESAEVETEQEFDEDQEDTVDDDLDGSFEFMETDGLSPEYQEEYIVEEVNPHQDEELEIEAMIVKPDPETLQVMLPNKVLKIIKKEDASNATLIPDQIALKSLKILIKYSEQQGHNDMLSQLIDYQRQLQESDL